MGPALHPSPPSSGLGRYRVEGEMRKKMSFDMTVLK